MKFTLLFLLSIASSAFSAKILAIFSVPSKSHIILVDPLLKELARRGHEVTVLTFYPHNEKIENYTEVGVQDLLGDGPWLDFFEMNNLHFLEVMRKMFDILNKLPDDVLKHPNVARIVRSDEKFDLILTEVIMVDALTAGFAYKFQVPIISLSTFVPNFFSNYLVGNPAPSSYITEPMIEISGRMTFIDRVLNMISGIAIEVFHQFFYLPIHDQIMRHHFGNDYPPIKDILKNTSLVLVNHHFSIAYPRPYVPNMIEIGGFHVRPPKKLPDDLQEFLDDAKEGAIYFSLGTNAMSSNMPKEKLQEFVKAFSQINAKILWKFEAEDLEGIPKNVKCQKWLPQSDILAHPNIKVFITHGGLLSTTEALVRGVPLVGIPIFGDQPFNMRQAEANGLGRMLDFKTLTADALVEAVNDVMYNTKYREVIRKKSTLLSDMPTSALERAVFWVEYVIRHKGAPHMRSLSQDLNWFQVNSVDVIAFLFSVAIIVALILLFIVKKFLRLLYRKKSKALISKKQR